MADTVPIIASHDESASIQNNTRYKTALAIGLSVLAALALTRKSFSTSFTPATTVRQTKKSLVPQQYWMNCYPGGDIAEYFGIAAIGIYETPSLALKCPKSNQRVISCSCGSTDGFVPTGNNFDWEGNSCECQWRSYWGRPFMGEFEFRGVVTCASFIQKNETIPSCELYKLPPSAK